MTVHALKPCPFCGNGVDLEIDTTPVSGGSVADYVEPPVIWCVTCDYSIEIPDHMVSVDEFVNWWNTRAEEPQL